MPPESWRGVAWRNSRARPSGELRDPLRVNVQSGQPVRQGDVAGDREPRQQRVILERDAEPVCGGERGRRVAADAHLAFVGQLEPGHDPQQRRLAAAAGTDDGDQLAAREIEADVLQCAHRSASSAARTFCRCR
jgi:hypothetical protein